MNKEETQIREKIIIAYHNNQLGHENCSKNNCPELIKSLITFWKNGLIENDKKLTEIIIQAVENFEDFAELLNNSLINQKEIEEIREKQKKCLILIGKCVISQLKIARNINLNGN